MPKDREKKTLNPATAHLKSEKARALKKGKAAVQAQRTDRLASRNPFRLERQIADLKALASDGGGGGGGGLAARDKKQLEELERQLGMVRRAREKVGDTRVPSTTAGREDGGARGGAAGRGRGGYNGLGKRMRGGERESSSGDGGSETDESVRAIPMPRDTPPPAPHSHRGRGGYHHNPTTTTTTITGNANMEPLGQRPSSFSSLPPRPSQSPTHPSTSTSAAAPKKTYTSAPAIRNLRKEAVTAFMPAVVARKVAAAKFPPARLLEEEEVERLEGEGYLVGRRTPDVGVLGRGEGGGIGGVGQGDGEGKGNGGEGVGRGLEEEEERFRREMEMELEGEGKGRGRKVGMEEVRDGRKVGMEEVRDEDL